MNNERQIAKQKFDEHFMFKDNPIAWTAWKMAFHLGIEHERLLHKTPCTALREKIEQELSRLSNPTIAHDERQHISVDVAKRKLQWVLSLIDELLPVA